MGVIRQWETPDSKYIVFSFPKEYSHDELAHWIYKIVSKEVVKTEFITVEDDRGSSREMETTTEFLRVPFEEKELFEKIERIHPNKISFVGKYRQLKAVILFNLDKHHVGLGADENAVLDAQQLEQDLFLYDAIYVYPY